MTEQTDLMQAELYDLDTELKKEPVGRPYDRNDLLDHPVKIKVEGLGISPFKKPLLMFTAEDGNSYTIALSRTNKNQLIEHLGSKLKDWIGKEITLIGKHWEGVIQGEQRSGVVVDFDF